MIVLLPVEFEIGFCMMAERDAICLWSIDAYDCFYLLAKRTPAPSLTLLAVR
jgi:hypothetical protein